MREDLLHYIWKHRKTRISGLFTSKNKQITVLNTGTHNHLSGPDFFNAQLRIGGQLWAGNVEMHVKSSDWYAHHHESDPNYDNVILHVVWENDVEIFGRDNIEIPALELKNFISKRVLSNYYHLFKSRTTSFNNCEKDIGTVDQFVLGHWMERMYFERLEEKSELIFELLKGAKNNWEEVLFVLLLKNFGLKINGEAFLSLGKALDFRMVRKISNNTLQLESVFFGMSGFLDRGGINDAYFLELQNEYRYLKQKFKLNETAVLGPQFFKLRPQNFPTIRLSQFATLYRKQFLFSKVMEAGTLKDYYQILRVSASKYWNSHYTFGKESGEQEKKMVTPFIDLLLINTILPLKFCYARHKGLEVHEKILRIAVEIKTEKNSTVANFKKYGVPAMNAKDSQALLQLYNDYCLKNKCLQCAVGMQLLSGK